MTTTLSAMDLPFDEAIAYLRQKTNVTSEHYADVFGVANVKSFAVAGAATEALVGDFRDELTKEITNGTSLGEFRKSFDDIVRRHGWEHTGSAGWRARVIYETNLGMAYSAGRYAQQTEPETLAAFPYWQYVHSGAAHPRPEHQSWDGTTLLASDPWWATHYAPNGWGCGCWVRVLSARQLARMGKSGPDAAPSIEWRPWTNPRTGEVVQVPKGIDPGFAYNPGREWKAEAVTLPANASLRAPVPASPEAARRSAAVEDFAARVLGGDINDPARAIHAAELPPNIADRLTGIGGNEVELSAFRVLKIAGRAGEMVGRPSTAHPEVTAKIWAQLQRMLDDGDAYASARHGWPQVEVVHLIDGRPWRLILRRVLQPDGSTRLDVPTLMRISDREAARFAKVRGRELLGK